MNWFRTPTVDGLLARINELEQQVNTQRDRWLEASDSLSHMRQQYNWANDERIALLKTREQVLSDTQVWLRGLPTEIRMTAPASLRAEIWNTEYKTTSLDRLREYIKTHPVDSD